tara:strand:+ start:972 stop:1739 length:768 start_codon:yes stop_codon:yes gene_type:complete
MEFHPIANIFPLMGEEDFNELVDDIRQNGLHQPIVVYEGHILDGRNRYRACKLAGVTPEYVGFDYSNGNDPLSYVLSLNLHRRHLTASQRAVLAAEIADMIQGERTDLEPCAKLHKVSASQAAEKLDVSRRYVQEAKKLQEESPEHFDQVKSGELSLQQAKREVTIEAHGVEIKSISDFDKAAKESSEVKAVNAWHNIYNAQRKIVVDFHRIYSQIGKEPLCQTLRENDMMGDCDDMLGWVEKTVGFIEEVRSER